MSDETHGTVTAHGEEARVEDGAPAIALDRLVDARIIRPRDWDRLALKEQRRLHNLPGVQELVAQLLRQELLTKYQGERLLAGRFDDLIIGNYRVVDLIGAGATGVVLKAEHYLLRRTVAVKILYAPSDNAAAAWNRFLNEVWALGQLAHPNIVGVQDAGEVGDGLSETAYYVVMEYVPGANLDDIVKTNGPLDPALACGLIDQIAGALVESHRHQLVHRDVKPSNIRVTPEGQAKLLDFGVTRVMDRRLTEPGVILGSLAYVAPEQAQDSGDVDIRADIFGLGGVLFWCLTGQTPFSAHVQSAAPLGQRLHTDPPRVRTLRPEIAAELDAFIASMMAENPNDRPAHPAAVQQGVSPFLKKPRNAASLRASSVDAAERRRAPVLIVDDEALNRDLCRYVLESVGLSCAEACDGQAALDAIGQSAHDLVLLDIDMPVLNGIEVLRQLRAAPPAPHLKIIMLSGRATADEMAQMMLEGADDYLTKPFSTTQLQARVKTALRLKEAQDRADALFGSLLTFNHELEKDLQARDSDLIQARNALVLALAELVAYRDTETGAHLMRLQRYCRCLADKASSSSAFQGSIDAHFTAMLECCAPLHDIGKAGVPDHILLKPGKLTPEEMVIMQSHTTIGANVLEKVARQHGFARAFLKMATDITRHHHERFDGRGYPDRLAGDAIPLSARIVAIADVYDALRSQRVYKAALSHDEALRIMLTQSPGHFDPALLGVFSTCADQFGRLYRELLD